MMKSYKTPLRYPGGKSRACQKMDVYFPDLREYKEYHEPFLGGGSVAIHVTKKYPQYPTTFYRTNRNSRFYDGKVSRFQDVKIPRCQMFQPLAKNATRHSSHFYIYIYVISCFFLCGAVMKF